MPVYVFHLHDGSENPAHTEVVDAADLQEVRALAELRLSLSTAFRRIEVEQSGVELFRLQRDSEQLR